MKKLVLLSLIPLALVAGGAHASGTKEFKSTGTVPAKCKFVSGTVGINFGSLDPSEARNVDATIPLAYECTWGVKPASIQVGTNPAGSYNGKLKLVGSTGGENKEIAYGLAWSTDYPTGKGFGGGAGSNGTEVSIPVQATIAADAYRRAAEGVYEEIISFTINP